MSIFWDTFFLLHKTVEDCNVPGDWRQSRGATCRYQTESGVVLTWTKSNQELTFEGPEPEATKFETVFWATRADFCEERLIPALHYLRKSNKMLAELTARSCPQGDRTQDIESSDAD